MRFRITAEDAEDAEEPNLLCVLCVLGDKKGSLNTSLLSSHFTLIFSPAGIFTGRWFSLGVTGHEKSGLK